MPHPVEELDPVGIATRKLIREKKCNSTARVVNRWYAYGHRQARDPQGGGDPAFAGGQPLAAEYGHDLGGDAEEQDRSNAGLVVAEEPQQVLPQDRTAAGGIEHIGRVFGVGGGRAGTPVTA